uniref:Uncharacterized protein n=1 Tax=Phlebotomus papatasi TaxID=29031 RepID=A0A1B0DAG9_PHLPP
MVIVSNYVNNEARRRRHHMLPMIAIGFTALGMILMPMGFQFLAVLGGKALLLAKLALILASINGLKRKYASLTIEDKLLSPIDVTRLFPLAQGRSIITPRWLKRSILCW